MDPVDRFQAAVDEAEKVYDCGDCPLCNLINAGYEFLQNLRDE